MKIGNDRGGGAGITPPRSGLYSSALGTGSMSVRDSLLRVEKVDERARSLAHHFAANCDVQSPLRYMLV